jgi:hypothetical protein
MKTTRKLYKHPQILILQVQCATHLLSGSFNGEAADTRNVTEADASMAASRGDDSFWDD